jgi:diguanylate cyclase (GGDEF)-like protein
VKCGGTCRLAPRPHRRPAGKAGTIDAVDLAGLFAARPRWVTVGVALVFLVTLGWADWVTGRDVSLSVFYVAPIALTTWFVNKRTGAFFAFLSTVTWFLADDMGRPDVRPLVPYWNAFVRFGFYFVIVVILAKFKLTLAHERNLSREDPTTGLANPRAFFEWASKEVERSRRFKRPVTLLYIDCDDFKVVNDNHGHAVGDDVLRAAAQAMKVGVRDLDFVARLGGDEFVVLLTETDAAGAKVAVRRLQELLSREMARSDRSVTFSVGAATFASGPSTVEEAIREADHLMYSAKTSGKNAARFAVYGA